MGKFYYIYFFILLGTIAYSLSDQQYCSYFSVNNRNTLVKKVGNKQNSGVYQLCKIYYKLEQIWTMCYITLSEKVKNK